MPKLIYVLVLLIVGTATQNQKSIIDEPNCGQIKILCNNLSENDDILILECLQSLKPEQLSMLDEKCQNKVWSHTYELFKDDNVKEILMPVCRDDLSRLPCNTSVQGGYLKCIINKRDDIQSKDCVQLLFRLENIAFQDSKWINNFLDQCQEDIKRLECGRISSNSLTQLDTVACLQTKILEVKDACKKEVFRLSELQGENIKLDRQLYLNCLEDHSRYCSEFPAGSGKVFTCLLRQDQNRLTDKCRQQLLRRQKLIAQDFKVSRGLMKACREDIKKTHCRRQTSEDKTVRLAQILLCLEGVMKNGTKIDSECENELMDHRRMLMEDYRLSPEIVKDCRGEIEHYCHGFDTGGRTIHCLMNHAITSNRDNSQFSAICRRALEVLVQRSDVGEDWRVDPVLHEACDPVVKVACRGIKGGNARVISCLMDSIGSDHMTEQCEDALIQNQYFVARDFKLDPQLYRACKNDARKYCHTSAEWVDENSIKPNYGPEVLPCLYRIGYQQRKDIELSSTCFEQVRRIMRQRAISVDLLPEIEESCLEDLGSFCNDKTKKGQETLCLQDHLEDLSEKCQKAVETLTEMEAEHIELNPYIMKYCMNEMESLCHAQLKNDEGDLFECLVSHKNSPIMRNNQKCRASIEHFQLISLKDYKFTYKFKIACKAYAIKLCRDASTKAQVVACLSEQILNNTLNDLKSSISKDCRHQLKSQLFQQRENINFNPKLKIACRLDIEKFCKNIEPGNAQVIECLQSQHGSLTRICEAEIFKVKKQEILDNSVDYALISNCAGAIQQFCPQHEKETVLECLKTNKDEKGFNKKCKQVVINRMIEQNTNINLNPSLQQHCKKDINKFCLNIVDTHNSKDINGPIIKCLKKQFKMGRLSNPCEKEMAEILREQALNLNLNPLLAAVCKNELETICKVEEKGVENAEECLKDALMNKIIQTAECQVEVANMLEESQADIHVDPLLQRACALDLLNYCNNVPQGNGRHMQCLKITIDKDPKLVSQTCRDMLSKRLEMYKKAAQINPPENLHELYIQMAISPSRHYLLLMVMIIFSCFFVIGIFFGRVTKRHTIVKNK